MNDKASPARRFWRISIRELLLLLLAAAVFFGWGQAIYRRFQPFKATPFAGYFTGGGLTDDVVVLHREFCASEADLSGGASAGCTGPSSIHREFCGDLPISSPDSAAFVDAVFKRIRQRIVENGCQEYRIAYRNSSEHDEGFNLHYRRDAVAGSILVVVTQTDSEHMRILATLDEHRSP